jgi:hypothetical protein
MNRKPHQAPNIFLASVFFVFRIFGFVVKQLARSPVSFFPTHVVLSLLLLLSLSLSLSPQGFFPFLLITLRLSLGANETVTMFVLFFVHSFL